MITLALLHPLNKTPLQHWTFEKDPVIRVGRSTDNDVVLYSAVVSRHHVELRQTPQGWQITSLGTNGTYLDGKRITEVPAEDGTIIRLARSGPNLQIHMGVEGYKFVQASLAKRQAPTSSPPQMDMPESSFTDIQPNSTLMPESSQAE